jgi:hypothetical protein
MIVCSDGAAWYAGPFDEENALAGRGLDDLDVAEDGLIL